MAETMHADRCRTCDASSSIANRYAVATWPDRWSQVERAGSIGPWHVVQASAGPIEAPIGLPVIFQLDLSASGCPRPCSSTVQLDRNAQHRAALDLTLDLTARPFSSTGQSSIGLPSTFLLDPPAQRASAASDCTRPDAGTCP